MQIIGIGNITRAKANIVIIKAAINVVLSNITLTRLKMRNIAVAMNMHSNYWCISRKSLFSYVIHKVVNVKENILQVIK